MAAEFPAAQPVFTGSTETAPATTSPAPFAAWAQKVEDEIVAMAAELGLEPSGTLLSTVRARLDEHGSRGIPPTLHGLKAWTFDPIINTIGTIWPNVTGVMRTIRLWTPVDISVTAVWVNVSTGGASLTAGQNRGALYDAAGTLIANSLLDDQSTAWTTATAKRMLVNGGTPVTVPAGPFDVGLWVTGTTAPTFTRAGANAALSGLNLTGVNVRYSGTNQTGTTTAPATVGSKTVVGEGWWVGIE